MRLLWQVTLCGAMLAEWWGRFGPCSRTDGRRIYVWLKCPNAGRRFSAVMTCHETYLITYDLQCWSVIARLRLVPPLHSIPCCPVFKLTRSSSLLQLWLSLTLWRLRELFWQRCRFSVMFSALLLPLLCILVLTWPAVPVSHASAAAAIC